VVFACGLVVVVVVTDLDQANKVVIEDATALKVVGVFDGGNR
jgi:hypothetical protein